jgi:hypothetical protein
VRVLRCGFRTGDRAPMAILEYVDRPGEVRLSRPVRSMTPEAAAQRALAYRAPAAAVESRKPPAQRLQ